MQLMYFTEQPMSAYPAEEGLKFGATALMFSNKYFDPVAGSRLYNQYLEHYIYAEEQGVEGHLNGPHDLQPGDEGHHERPDHPGQQGEEHIPAPLLGLPASNGSR